MTDTAQVPDESEHVQAQHPIQEPPRVPVPDVVPSIAELARSVRRHRIWLIILTLVLVLPLIASCGSIAFLASTFGPMSDMSTIQDEEADRTRQEIEDALGDRIEDLEVRVVSMSYGDSGFPFSLMPSGYDEQSLYVEYRLKDSGVVVADLVGPYAMDAASAGLIPTRGSLASRMTDQQYDRLIAAYAAESNSPLGSVRRYNDAESMMMEETTVPAEVVVGDTTYPSKELWSATEGRIVRGESFNADEEMSFTRRVYVFHEDPKTGEFTPLGTESAEIWW